MNLNHHLLFASLRPCLPENTREMAAMSEPGPSTYMLPDGEHVHQRRPSVHTVASTDSRRTSRTSTVTTSSLQSGESQDLPMHFSIPSVSSFHSDDNVRREVNAMRTQLNSERTRADHAETQLLQVVTRLTKVNQERMVAVQDCVALRDELLYAISKSVFDSNSS